MRSVISLAITSALFFTACGSTGIQPQSGRTPSQVMSYRGADWLERSSRAAEENPERLLGLMELEKGEVVADIGAGTGYFSRRIAGRVAPEGKVYAVDIQPQMLDRLNELAQREGTENIVPADAAVSGTDSDAGRRKR